MTTPGTIAKTPDAPQTRAIPVNFQVDPDMLSRRQRMQVLATNILVELLMPVSKTKAAVYLRLWWRRVSGREARENHAALAQVVKGLAQQNLDLAQSMRIIRQRVDHHEREVPLLGQSRAKWNKAMLDAQKDGVVVDAPRQVATRKFDAAGKPIAAATVEEPTGPKKVH